MNVPFISHFLQLLRHAGLLGIFIPMFAENIALPIPIEISYLMAVAMLRKGEHSWIVILLVLTAGHIIGSLTGYAIGKSGDRWFHRRFSKNERIRETHGKLITWYHRYGNATVFATRFIGYIRPWTSFIAGFAEFPFWPFIIWTSIGSLFFNALALYGSWLLVNVWRDYTAYHFVIVILFTFSFLAFIVYGLSKNKKPQRIA